MSPTPGERPQRELWRYLWGWTLGALLVVWLTLVGVAWYTGHHEAEEITDGQLVAVARLWLSAEPDPAREVPTRLNRHRVKAYVQDLAVLQWDGDRLVADTHGMAPGLDLAAPPLPGLSERAYRGEGEHSAWRMYVGERVVDGQVRRVAVLMDMAQRYDLGKDVAEHVARPALLLLPLIALVLWWTIRRGLRPLERLSSEVAALDGFAGQRLDDRHRFREFYSTVTAINTLVDTLQTRAQRERAFASDVAHELRTPLAAMALQARAAQTEPTPEHLHQLEQASLRAGDILAQLLDLARAQRGGPEQAPATVGLGEVAAGLIASHAPLAYETGHELSLVQPEAPVTVWVAPMLLELALRNLIENALRHTPPDTQVLVEVWQHPGGCGVSVCDDGQRAGADTTRLPVQAGDGLGLGLRLVQRIAEQMGATLERGDAPPPMTTRFTLCWAR